MNIVGISAYYHDSAAALIRDGEIIAAAQEERFTRKKGDHRFPSHALEYVLKAGGLRSVNDADYLVFYDKPLTKFERLLSTYVSFAPGGIRSFIKAMPLWLKEKLHMPREIRKIAGILGETDGLGTPDPRVIIGAGILLLVPIVYRQSRRHRPVLAIDGQMGVAGQGRKRRPVWPSGPLPHGRWPRYPSRSGGCDPAAVGRRWRPARPGHLDRLVDP